MKQSSSVSVNLDEIECQMIDNHINVVELTDTIKLIFTYPLLSDFKHINKGNQTEMMFELVQQIV